MKSIDLLIVYFLLLSKITNAQNLVLNPSFEDYDTKLKYPTHWKRITLTPDFYTKTEKKTIGATKQSYFDYNDYLLNTFDDVYMSICTNHNQFGENLRGTLATALEKDMIYLVKMKAIRSKKFGIVSYKTVNVLITDKDIPQTPTDSVVMLNEPFIYPYKNDSSEITDRNNWVDISTTYVAKGGENYIYLSSQKLTTQKGGLTICLDSISVFPTHVFVNKPIKIDSIFFETGKAILKETSIKNLDALIPTLTTLSNSKIKINGHTDNVGRPESNILLSSNRAKAVVNYFISKGISKNRITYEGFGDKKPIGDNSTEEGRAKNRRIEIEFSN